VSPARSADNVILPEAWRTLLSAGGATAVTATAQLPEHRATIVKTTTSGRIYS
jgi:hypothetical protein